mgnify:FL=1
MLASLTAAQTSTGVTFEDELRGLTDAAIHGEWTRLMALREQAKQTLGAQQVTDALVVAAAFNGITRVADATGIPLDSHTAAATQQMREETGIQRFSYLEKSARYDL